MTKRKNSSISEGQKFKKFKKCSVDVGALISSLESADLNKTTLAQDIQKLTDELEVLKLKHKIALFPLNASPKKIKINKIDNADETKRILEYAHRTLNLFGKIIQSDCASDVKLISVLAALRYVRTEASVLSLTGGSPSVFPTKLFGKILTLFLINSTVDLTRKSTDTSLTEENFDDAPDCVFQSCISAPLKKVWQSSGDLAFHFLQWLTVSFLPSIASSSSAASSSGGSGIWSARKSEQDRRANEFNEQIDQLVRQIDSDEEEEEVEEDVEMKRRKRRRHDITSKIDEIEFVSSNSVDNKNENNKINSEITKLWKSSPKCFATCLLELLMSIPSPSIFDDESNLINSRAGCMSMREGDISPWQMVYPNSSSPPSELKKLFIKSYRQTFETAWASVLQHLSFSFDRRTLYWSMSHIHKNVIPFVVRPVAFFDLFCVGASRWNIGDVPLAVEGLSGVFDLVVSQRLHGLSLEVQTEDKTATSDNVAQTETPDVSLSSDLDTSSLFNLLFRVFTPALFRHKVKVKFMQCLRLLTKVMTHDILIQFLKRALVVAVFSDSSAALWILNFVRSEIQSAVLRNSDRLLPLVHLNPLVASILQKQLNAKGDGMKKDSSVDSLSLSDGFERFSGLSDLYTGESMISRIPLIIPSIESDIYEVPDASLKTAQLCLFELQLLTHHFDPAVSASATSFNKLCVPSTNVRPNVLDELRFLCHEECVFGSFKKLVSSGYVKSAIQFECPDEISSEIEFSNVDNIFSSNFPLLGF